MKVDCEYAKGGLKFDVDKELTQSLGNFRKALKKRFPGSSGRRSMVYFLHRGVIVPDRPFVMRGEEADHIVRSRRTKRNELIHVQDSAYRRYGARVVGIAKHGIELLAENELPPIPESHFEISLFQALTKEKALDNIIQKTTELGVSSIFLFRSGYSQTPKKGSDLSKRLSRWKRIAQEACKQSDRAKPPPIDYLGRSVDFAKKMGQADLSDFPLLLLDRSGPPLGEIELKAPKGCGIVIGPEGGWQGEEIDCERRIKVSVGRRTLRADTAAIVATGILQYLYGDLRSSIQSPQLAQE